MPELPDVEVYKRYVDSTALRKQIDSLDVRKPRILKTTQKRLRAALVGRRFHSTRRHGKHLFIALDSGAWLAMHFGMTGYLGYFKGEDPEPDYDRLVIGFRNGDHLGYYDRRLLGRVDLIDDPDAAIASKPLGPDALDPHFDFAAFKARLTQGDGSKQRRGIIKAVLMNQTLIAGIGNIYSDEILFQARVHPQVKVNELDDKALRALFRAMKTVLEKAISRDADPDRLPKNFLIPHRKAGETCPGGGKVAHLTIGGRSTYYCPQCQHNP